MRDSTPSTAPARSSERFSAGCSIRSPSRFWKGDLPTATRSPWIASTANWHFRAARSHPGRRGDATTRRTLEPTVPSTKPPAGPPPRPQKPSDRRTFPPRPRSAIWYFVGVFLLLALVQAYLFSPTGPTIPYSEFKAQLSSDNVAEVSIGETSIRARLKVPRSGDAKASTTVTTTRVEDPKLVEELEARKVKFAGELSNRWLPELLGWILPLVLIVALFSFFFRRMGGSEGGVMSFARSKGKIYAESDVKVSFGDVAGVDEAENELREIVEFLRTPKKYHEPGRPHPEGRPARRPPGHRQDVARARGGRRGEGPLLQPERVGVRRDVRRRRGRARARSVQPGRGEGPVHCFHRRTRRPRQDARAERAWQPRGAGTDAESAPGRDGRF